MRSNNAIPGGGRWGNFTPIVHKPIPSFTSIATCSCGGGFQRDLNPRRSLHRTRRTFYPAPRTTRRKNLITYCATAADGFPRNGLGTLRSVPAAEPHAADFSEETT